LLLMKRLLVEYSVPTVPDRKAREHSVYSSSFALIDITGTVTEGGPSSRVYDVQSRVFSVELRRGEQQGCFAVYVGSAHPHIDLVFALRWFIDTASQAEEETYERWLDEDGTFYQTELGDEEARSLYEGSHEMGRKLRQVLGEGVYAVLTESIRIRIERKAEAHVRQIHRV
jgi:hypothetical protein